MGNDNLVPFFWRTNDLHLPWLERYPASNRIYRKCGRYVPLGTFAAGFIWDSLTLTRIDRWFDNLILMGYLIGLAAMIIITLRRQAGCIQVRWLQRLEPNFHWAIQFLLGSLFSSYVVFYSKSASWTQTEFFFVLLVILLIGNEFLEHRLGNDKLLAILFFFCLFSFLVFFLPIVLRSVTRWVFLLAGGISVVVSLWVFALALSRKTGTWGRRMSAISICIVVTYLFLNICYFANLIPPVPLGLKEAGIYHRVMRTAAGYEVQYSTPPGYRFWKQWDDPFFTAAGKTVFCYTAVFAPNRIHVPVRHVWSRFSGPAGWVVTDRISFEISGGREGGYRGYSQKKALGPGEWRVAVETDQGQILGRIDFTVADEQTPAPPLITRLLR